MATHKRSQAKIEKEKYKRHARPMAYLTHLFSGAEGIMHNPKADNVSQRAAQAAVSKSGRCDLRYGIGQTGKIRKVRYKDENGNYNYRLITVNSIINSTARSLITDKTMAAQLNNGMMITTKQVIEHNLKWSGFLQRGIQAYREFKEEDLANVA